MKKIFFILLTIWMLGLGQHLNAQCFISYSYTPLSNGAVLVTAIPIPTQSVGTIVWNAGSAGAGIGSPFTVTFTSNGTYSIAITYSAPCMAFTTAVITVTNVGVCVPQVITSPASSSTSCNGGATVTGVPGMCPGAITYTWVPSLSIGATANGLCPGSHTVYASSSGSGTNCCSTASAVVTINTCSVTANFNKTINGNVVSFTNTSQNFTNPIWQIQTTPSSTTISTYTTTNLTHTFTQPGMHTLTLTVQGGGGCVATKIDTVIIPPPCNAAFSYTINNFGNVSFTALNSGTNTTIRTWSFGGAVLSTTGNVNANHTFTSVGVFNVTLTVPGCGASVQSLVICPTPSLVLAGNSGATYTFNSLSAPLNMGSNVVYSHLWSIPGTGITSTTTPFVHTFTNNGSYYIKLKLVQTSTVGGFCNVQDSIPILINNSTCNPVPAFSHTLGSAGWVLFQSNSTNTNSNTTYIWHYGDGAIGANGISVHQYTAAGVYTVNLIVVNSSNCSDSIATPISVQINTCGLISSFTHTLGSNGVVAFTDVSAGTNTSTIRTWYFGNGITSNLSNPTVTYSSAGNYVVKLVLKNNFNCWDSTNMSINITGIPCVANANFTLTPGNQPQHWVATPAFPWNVSAATWSWGDNTTSNGLYTAHQYSISGNYNICLTVTASCGSTATACSSYSIFRGTGGQIVYVNVESPEYTTGISESNGIVTVKLYPNPTDGMVQVISGTSMETLLNAEVYNITGSLVFSEKVLVNENGQAVVDLTALPSGYYIVKTKINNQVSTHKLLISK